VKNLFYGFIDNWNRVKFFFGNSSKASNPYSDYW
jgi:hypothetical protein